MIDDGLARGPFHPGPLAGKKARSGDVALSTCIIDEGRPTGGKGQGGGLVHRVTDEVPARRQIDGVGSGDTGDGRRLQRAGLTPVALPGRRARRALIGRPSPAEKRTPAGKLVTRSSGNQVPAHFEVDVVGGGNRGHHRVVVGRARAVVPNELNVGLRRAYGHPQVPRSLRGVGPEGVPRVAAGGVHAEVAGEACRKARTGRPRR